jgi:hypothetical protein
VIENLLEPPAYRLQRRQDVGEKPGSNRFRNARRSRHRSAGLTISHRHIDPRPEITQEAYVKAQPRLCRIPELLVSRCAMGDGSEITRGTGQQGVQLLQTRSSLLHRLGSSSHALRPLLQPRTGDVTAVRDARQLSWPHSRGNPAGTTRGTGRGSSDEHTRASCPRERDVS